MIDLYASEPHYLRHLMPVHDALGVDAGIVYVGRPGMAALTSQPSRPTLVASGGDVMVVTARRPVALMQHGCGQSYNGAGESRLSWGYVGGSGMSHVGLFLCTNEAEAEAWRAVYPDARVAVVGAPCMDEWHGIEFRQPAVPIVAVAFHWKSLAQIESGTAWPDWRNALAEVALHAEEHGYRLLGHEHPRWFGRVLDWWRRLGVEVTDDWREVMQRASVYVCDNSSTLYEFMATGRPVIGLRSTRWRRDVEHGLRFWRFAPPVDLAPRVGAYGLDCSIRAALDHGPVPEEASIVREVFGRLDGLAAARAADALRAWVAVVGSWDEREEEPR